MSIDNAKIEHNLDRIADALEKLVYNTEIISRSLKNIDKEGIICYNHNKEND